MSTSRRKASDEFMPLPDGQEAHWEVCERILFVYTKLNPGLGYIQVQLKFPVVTNNSLCNLFFLFF